MHDVAAIDAPSAFYAFAEADPESFIKFVRHPNVAFTVAPLWGVLFRQESYEHADPNDFN